MKFQISRKNRGFRNKALNQDIDFLLSRNYQKTTIWTYLLYAFEVFFEPVINVVQIISDIVTLVKLIFFNKASSAKYFQPWVPFSVSKWIYITTIPISFFIIIYKIVQSILLIKHTNNIMLIYLNTTAKKILTIQKGISVYLIFQKIQETANSKAQNTNFNRLCFFTWEQLHNWQFIMLNSPKQIINALTLWSLFVSKNQKNLADLNSLSNIISKIKKIGEYNRPEAVILFAMLVSLASYFVLAVVFLVGVFSLLYIENQLLANDSKFGNRWIPFFREERSSLKEYILLQLLANLEQQNLESELNEKSNYWQEKKQWLDIFNKDDVKNHVTTPSRIYKYV